MLTRSRILSYLFSLIYSSSVIGKLFYPDTIYSWVQAFYAQMGLLFIMENGVSITYYLILFLEIILVVYITSNKKSFIYLNIGLLFFFFLITSYAYLFQIPGDCGCFGKIIVFENGWDKALFNGVLFGLSIVLYYLAQKEKAISEKLLQTQDV